MAKGFRHGSGGELRKVPVLNEAYPQNMSVTDAGTSVSFSVLIAEAGNPANYTYQWYYDGNLVTGANKATYTRAAEFGEHNVYCVVDNGVGTVISRKATVKATTLYLLKGSNQYSTITGGWKRVAPSSKHTLSIGSNGAILTATQDSSMGIALAAFTTNKVDLTKAKTLSCYVTVGTINYDHSYKCNLGVTSAAADVNQATVAVSGNRTSSGTLTCDVSKLSGSYHIKAYVYCMQGTFNDIKLTC